MKHLERYLGSSKCYRNERHNHNWSITCDYTLRHRVLADHNRWDSSWVLILISFIPLSAPRCSPLPHLHLTTKAPRPHTPRVAFSGYLLPRSYAEVQNQLRSLKGLPSTRCDLSNSQQLCLSVLKSRIYHVPRGKTHI